MSAVTKAVFFAFTFAIFGGVYLLIAKPSTAGEASYIPAPVSEPTINVSHQDKGDLPFLDPKTF